MSELDKPGEPSSLRPASGLRTGSIPLYLINGVATVWDAQGESIDSIHLSQSKPIRATLSMELNGLPYRELGPELGQMNGFLGLPVTLMQEETAYLVMQGIAHLLPVSAGPAFPSPELVARRTEERLARLRAIEARNRASEEAKAARSAKAFMRGGEQAKAKREERARMKAAKVAQAGGGDAGEAHSDGKDRVANVEEEERGQATNGKGQAPAKDTDGFGLGLFGGETAEATGAGTAGAESSSIKPMPDTSNHSPDVIVGQSLTAPIPAPAAAITGAHFHTVPSHPLFPTLVHSSPPITRLPHPLFPFPSCPRDRALIATFTDLQQQGYRMGLGPRFGGEYLIYPGDYLRYHAHFTSQVLVRDEPIKPTEIVAWGRLGTGTKKAGLICCWDDDGAEFEPSGEKDGQVEYYSLEWASFG
ncbi:tRNA-splicing endonuclease subunit [Saitozyma podzolica]|uniref:tRNA-intron lyase n=1 Tax=Saitozyma podzolica TaxID=1890683 RepID=A0A427YTY2_9TREE|nr:tRNA-splicing endonuclease subunit [Saitozyma podzolica]